MPTLDNHNRIVVSVSDVRAVFPEFSDATAYPDAIIGAAITAAGNYVSTVNYGELSFDCRAYLIELMAAHLVTVMTDSGNNTGTAGAAASGGVSGAVQSAHIGDVSVSVAIPQGMNELNTWLWQTPYGQQYLALLKTRNFPKYFASMTSLSAHRPIRF